MLTKKWWYNLKNFLIPIILVIVCVAVTLPLNSPVSADGGPGLSGGGTSSDPYIIANEHDLDVMATFYQEASGSATVYYYSLSNDIALTSDNFAPIGTSGGETGVPFNGHFNGNGHVISGLKIDADILYCGLFGMTSDATITNLGLQNVNISDTNNDVGGLVGDENENKGGSAISNCSVSGTITGNNVVGGLIGDYSADGYISNCYSTASVNGNGSSTYMGGLIGYVQYGSLSNCFASGPVTGNKYIGGLVGYCDDVNMSYCYATGSISGDMDDGGQEDAYEGGLLGYGTSDSNFTIQYCYATGGVTGTSSGSEVGGLIGNISTSNGSEYNLTYCNATGNVTGGNPASGNGDTGGLIGSSSGCDITYCYAQGEVTGGDPSGNTYTGGLIGRSSGDDAIEHCWATGSVTTGYEIGGLIGKTANDVDITCCYATGDVNIESDDTPTDAGGLIGYNYATNVTDCYSQGDVTTEANWWGGLMGYSKNGVYQGSTYGTITDCYATSDYLTNNDDHNPVIETGCYSDDGVSDSQSSYEGWDFKTVWTTNGDTSLPFFIGQFTVTPDGGYYLTTQSMVIDGQLDGNETIFYTTDGSTPNTDSPSITSDNLPFKIIVNGTETIKSIMYDNNLDAPQVNTAVFTAPIAISTASLPSGYTSVSYSFNLNATGGNGTYTWTQAAGTIPTGLTLSSAGVISGTPTASGRYNFTVQVSDNSSDTITQGLTINITSSGLFYDWGVNNYGQLGNATTTDITTGPAQLSGMNGVLDVSAGGSFTLVLKSDGTVWSFGNNSNGQLGNGTTTNSSVPVQVSGLNGVISIAAGDGVGVALKSDGTVWDWGINSNSLGSLGNGNNTDSSVPVQVRDTSGQEYLTGIVAIAAGGNNFNLALKSDGTVYAWGFGGNGQLGNNDTSNNNLPVQVLAPDGTSYLSNVTAIAAGYDQCLALKLDGSVWAWGANSSGEDGDGTTTSNLIPVQVKDPTGSSTLTDVTAIAGGDDYSMALKSDGTVWIWGDNSFGELGTGSTTPSYSYLPVQASGLSGVFTSISTSWRHSLALKSDGTVWAWGDNPKGELGVPSSSVPFTAQPIQVTGLIGGATVISAGSDDSAAISTALTGKIVFYSQDSSGNYQIYSMNTDGSDRTQLTNDTQDGAPCLSPDGTKIVYTKSVGEVTQLWEMNSDGSGQTMLDNPPLYGDDNPSWSPDGTKIVFQSSRSVWNEIYIINANGTGLTEVAGLPSGADNIYPSFSPDGKKILFLSGNGIYIYIANLDGSALTKIYTTTQMQFLKWSPDSSKISYDLTTYPSKIYTVTPDGKTNTYIGPGAEAAWSPDGQYMVYFGSTGGISIMNMSSGSVAKISSNPYDQDPNWGTAYVFNPASTLAVDGFPNPCTVGTAGTVTVTAKDSSGNTAVGYNGTVHFTSTDSEANLPSDYTFTAIDSGSHTFTSGVTFNTTGTQSVIAKDTTTGSITGAQSDIVVNSVSTTTTTTSTTTTTTTMTTTTTTTSPAQDATLSNLTISSGSLSPTFSPQTIAYADSVPYSVSSVTVVPTGNASPSKITVNGVTVTTGTASAAIPLSAGANTIAVVVISQDGSANDTYTVIVTRGPPSTDAKLSSLAISSGSLSPSFSSGTTSYSDSVVSGTNTITVTPTVDEGSNATITVNGNAVASDSPSGAINLNVGNNTITIAVTAQDGVTTKTYTVTVNVAAPTTTTTTSTTTTTTTTTIVQPPPLSTDATLSNLAISAGTLTPAFAAGTTSYADSVAYLTTPITVTATADESHATVKVNGISVASGSPSGAITLNVGANTITIAVTAQDGITTDTYAITVTMASLTTTTTTTTTPVVSSTTTTTTAITTTAPISTTSTTTTTTTTTSAGTTDLSSDVSANGTFTSNASASSANGDVTVNIPAGITGLTASGAPITQITITPITTNLPALPSGGAAVGSYFDIQPSGSTFSSPITITVSYDPSQIPAGTSPYVAWYNPATGEWEQLTTVSIDTVNHTITASVNHFSTFAVLAALAKTTTTTSETMTGTAAESTGVLSNNTTTTTKSSGSTGTLIIIIICAVIVIAAIIFIVFRSGKRKQ